MGWQAFDVAFDGVYYCIEASSKDAAINARFVGIKNEWNSE